MALIFLPRLETCLEAKAAIERSPMCTVKEKREYIAKINLVINEIHRLRGM
jgi:hypothetical protein